MGQMQENLHALLAGDSEQHTLPPLRLESVASEAWEDLRRVYKALGGIRRDPPSRPGHWDTQLGAVAVELDECLHFNRYRALTLESPFYEGCRSFPVDLYLIWCAELEERCTAAGSYGGKWTNHSCEAQFGPAAPKGDLSGNGSPRWKQRAFYDCFKDMAAKKLGLSVVRLSVHETIELRGESFTLEQLLKRPPDGTEDAISELIRRRSSE
jgi:hypothetical protein